MGFGKEKLAPAPSNSENIFLLGKALAPSRLLVSAKEIECAGRRKRSRLREKEREKYEEEEEDEEDEE
ncbi:hypothetical protein M0802_000148 [Mischocyttarus mexicanus]|nr:hypothetical protein M0802_000148 [Mischocyttarus mexicanus]